jgi:CDP-glucose 4,6-dehydratase
MENLVMRQDIRKIYEGKKVLVTGHTGFKGTWLTAMLYILGAKVKGYALAPEDSKPFYDLFLPYKIVESVIADIRNKEKLQEEIESFQPDFIFHLAAQALVRRSYKIPAETFEVNVVGTANLLESVVNLEKKCSIVVITTDKVYQNKEKHVLYKENDELGGYDPYSASKACTELVVNSFRNSFFNPEKYKLHQKAIASARAGNVIGGGDWNIDRIVPDIIRSLQQDKIIEVRNPKSVRPWQHVVEPILGYLKLGASLNEKPKKYSKAYNFGPLPKDHLTVKQLVKIAIKNWGGGEWKNIASPDKLHEAALLKLNTDRAKKELKWEPKLNSEEAIRWAIDWYKQPDSNQAEFTFNQIRNYFTL